MSHRRPTRQRGRARALTSLAAVTLTGLGTAGVLGGGSAAVADPAVTGSFSPPIAQPGAPTCTFALDQQQRCAPAGASVMVLPNGTVYFWDALEGMEDVRLNVVAEYGSRALNDQSRVISFGGPAESRPTFTTPLHQTGGANLNGNPTSEPLAGGVLNTTDPNGSGDLFCSDQVMLADGSVLDVGGTDYYQEPGVKGTDFGVIELEGLKNSRIFHPATTPAADDWTQGANMTYGRWYPGMVTLADGKVLVTSGVTKLIKPVYPNRPLDSGTNVEQTETYNPATGKFTVNPPSANKSLPLFPRIHLLPDGKVYYDAAGQTFNPFGQSYDEALWNLASIYDPATQSWRDLGLPMLGVPHSGTTAGAPLGFRGSGFSVMLPLVPDATGQYTKASFLSAGGVYGVSPGAYLGVDTATVNTVNTAANDAWTSKVVSPMKAARWYGSGTVLPTGQVFVSSGAAADEVVLPGSSTPVTQDELYDPTTNTWTAAATQAHGRTYHNSAVLLPDGRVLVGGHAPIGTGYATNGLGDVLDKAGLSAPERDSTFEVYSPPYLSYGPQPVITSLSQSSLAYGSPLTITTPDAANVASVALVRNTAITHLVDGDQRTVDLPVIARTANTVTVRVPAQPAAAPAGPYMVFINAARSRGLEPSVSKQVFVGAPVPAYAAGYIAAANGGALSHPVPAEATAPAARGGAHSVTVAAPAAAGRAPVAAAPVAALSVVPATAAQRRSLAARAAVGPSSRLAPLAMLAAGLLLGVGTAFGGVGARLARRR